MRAILLTFLMIFAPSVAAQPVASTKQASIEDSPLGAIRDWHADDAKGIYLRDQTDRWYYGVFRHQCPGVLYGEAVSFRTFGDRRFDRSSQVVTRFGNCSLESLVESTAPAAKGGKAKRPHH